jgi:DNA mismatch repair ATPase MutS
MELLQKFLNKSDEIDPENKKEHELNTADRMILINKKTDENFLIETYENLIKTKKFINIEDIHSVDINDYVFDDVEFTHDHYLNNDKGLFYKLDKSSTKIGSLLLKNIFLKPIYDIDVLKNRQDIIKKIYNAKNDIIPILNEIIRI